MEINDKLSWKIEVSQDDAHYMMRMLHQRYKNLREAIESYKFKEIGGD